MLTIIQGRAVSPQVRLIQPVLPAPPLDFPGKMYVPYPLTGATAISTCFQNADGTETMLTLGSGISIVGDAALGIIQLSLTAAQTALLTPVTGQALQLSIAFGGDPIGVLIPDAYEVVTSLC